jgi:hypothetical protein
MHKWVATSRRYFIATSHIINRDRQGFIHTISFALKRPQSVRAFCTIIQWPQWTTILHISIRFGNSVRGGSIRYRIRVLDEMKNASIAPNHTLQEFCKKALRMLCRFFESFLELSTPLVVVHQMELDIFLHVDTDCLLLVVKISRKLHNRVHILLQTTMNLILRLD